MMRRRLLIGCALTFMALFLLIPLLTVFAQALAKGVAAYYTAITEPAALSAIFRFCSAAMSSISCVFSIL